MPDPLFGLREDPFGDRAEPRFYVAGPKFEAISGYLTTGRIRGIVLITGAEGAGKSILLRKLAAGHPDAVLHCCAPEDTATDLFAALAVGKGIAKQPEAARNLEEWRRILRPALAKSGETAVLLLDDVSELADETLIGIRNLADLKSGKRRLVRVIMTATPALQKRLNDGPLLTLKRAISAHHRLDPVAATDVGDYIVHRLRTAGYGGKPLFDDEAVALIAARSGGVPPEINRLCRRSLDLAVRNSYKIVTADAVRQADDKIAPATTAEMVGDGAVAAPVPKLLAVRIVAADLSAGDSALGLTVDGQSLQIQWATFDRQVLQSTLTDAPALESGRGAPAVTDQRPASDPPPKSDLGAQSKPIDIDETLINPLIPEKPAKGETPTPPTFVERAVQAANEADQTDGETAAPAQTLPALIAKMPRRPALAGATAIAAALLATAGAAYYLSPADRSVTVEVVPPAGPDSAAAADAPVTSALADSDGATDIAPAAGPAGVPAADVQVPQLAVSDIQTLEDNPIALDITLAAGDGQPDLPVTVSGLPQGATLSAGSADGEAGWKLTAGQLEGLMLTPPENGDGSFDLTVTAGSAIKGAVTSSKMTVDVVPAADIPILTVTDVAGREDSAIPLDIAVALADNDGSETLTLLIAGVPDGATLSAGTHLGGGRWSLMPGDHTGLTITPPANSSDDFTLTVTAQAAEARNGDAIDTSAKINVRIDPTADVPSLTVIDAMGREDEPIIFPIGASISDGDGSESLTLTVHGLPAGARFSAGEPDGEGGWILPSADLERLTFLPPPDFNGAVRLSIVAKAAEGDDIALTDRAATIMVSPVADTPSLTVSDLRGVEDEPVSLTLSAKAANDSEDVAITIAGFAEGTVLSAGTEQAAGLWRLSPEDLPDLRALPPENYSGTMTLTVEATSTDGSDWTVVSDDMTLTIEPVADMPRLSLDDVAGKEDAVIPLKVAAATTGLGETLSVTVEGLPPGAELSAGTGKGESRTLTEADLVDLTLTPPPDFNGRIDLSVTASSTDQGETNSARGVMSIAIEPVADPPILNAEDAAGREDEPVSLRIDAKTGAPNGREELTIAVDGVPAGARLSAGRQQDGGRWILRPEDLPGLTLTLPADSDTDIALNIVATSTEPANEDSAEASRTINIELAAVADPPQLTVEPASGREDTGIALTISADVSDEDGSESLEIVIAGLPEGASLNGGEAVSTGVWRLAKTDLEGLTMTPPEGFSGQFELAVTATSREQANRASAEVSEMLSVEVAPVTDLPSLTVADATGDEDTAIALDIAAASGDPDGSETLSLAIAGLPDGSTLSKGSSGSEGIWALDPEDLTGLALTPPEDFSGDITLSVTALSRERGSDEAVDESTDLRIAVSPVADPPMLAVKDAEGVAGETVSLPIDAAPGDNDGSEVLTLRIEGLADGMTLSAGEKAGGGAWEVDQFSLGDLALTTAEGHAGSTVLTVIARSRDGGDEASTETTLQVTLTAPAKPVAVAAAPVPVPQQTKSIAPTPKPDVESPKIVALIKRGDTLLDLRDVSSARLLFELAADSGSARAATAVGKTYDPVVHATLGVIGASADPIKAMAWYEKAIANGDSEAESHIEALTAWLNASTDLRTAAEKVGAADSGNSVSTTPANTN